MPLVQLLTVSKIFWINSKRDTVELNWINDDLFTYISGKLLSQLLSILLVPSSLYQDIITYYIFVEIHYGKLRKLDISNWYLISVLLIVTCKLFNIKSYINGKKFIYYKTCPLTFNLTPPYNNVYKNDISLSIYLGY